MHADVFIAMYVAKTAVHIPMLWLLQMKQQQRRMMVGHHALSIIAYSCPLMTHRSAYWSCLDGMCEMSTIFLNILYIFKETGTEKKYPTAYSINGVCLWLSFMIFRLALFPYWLHKYIGDYRDHHSTWAEAYVVEKYVFPATTVFLLALSAMWSVPITKGLMKALFTKGGDDFKVKDA